MKTEHFGKLPSGEGVELYTLSNKNGLQSGIASYGGIVVSLQVPGRDGRLDDAVLGYDSLNSYLHDEFYLARLSAGIPTSAAPDAARRTERPLR